MYDELKKAAEAATPGPWSTDDPWIVYAKLDGEVVYLANTEKLDTQYMQSSSNAAYIAAANPAVVLALLADRERLLAALAGITEMAERCDSWQSFPQGPIDIAHAAIAASEGP